MREIKFRAWDPESYDNGYMVYSDGRDKKNWPCGYGFWFDNENKLTCRWYEDYDDSFGYPQENSGELENIMQFTGLMDKNGNEIYDGDLCADGDDLVQIVWSERHQWGGKIVKTEYVLTKNLTFPLWQWDKCKENGNRELLVIGNIHENPDLLEQQPCG